MLSSSWLIGAAFLMPIAVGAADDEMLQYSPYADLQHATEVFWGDTHVHSSWASRRRRVLDRARQRGLAVRGR